MAVIAALAAGGIASVAVAAGPVRPAPNQSQLSNLLLDAVRTGDLATVRSVVDGGADVTELDEQGRSMSR